MTTKYMYERDITGAPGPVLPFSDSVLTGEIVNDSTVTIVIPSQYKRYVAELSVYPKQSGYQNYTPIQWKYYPDASLPDDPNAPIVVTTGERIMKYVNGGSRIEVSKVRPPVIPPTTLPDIAVNITLFAEGNS